MKPVLVTAALVVALAAPALAKGSPDQKFIDKAAKGGMAEVAMGEMAAKKATNADVKAFGQQMATDHSKANKELMNLAAKLGVSLPKAMEPKASAAMAKMMKLKGKDFDKAYVADMVEDHKQDIAEFEQEAKDGKDAKVKAWAAATLPTLKHHLEMIQGIQAKMK